MTLLGHDMKPHSNEWEEILLEDLAEEITVGYVGSMTSEYVEKGVPFFRSKNITPYNIIWDDVKYISQEFHDKIKKSILKPGDVVIVRTGKPGTASIVPDTISEANCSDLVIVRPGPILDKRFLVYYLNSAATHHINAHLVGAVQQHFNVGAAKKISIPLPPLPEQKAIAHILGSFDDKIELNRKMNETLEGMAQALFKSWFVDFDPVIDNILRKNLDRNQVSPDLAKKEESTFEGIPEEFRERAEVRLEVLTKISSSSTTPSPSQAETDPLGDLPNIGNLFPSAFRESEELGWIPEGWEVSKFGDVASAIRDSVNPSNFDEDYPYVGLEHIGRKNMYLSDWGVAGDVDSNKSVCQGGDVLFGKLRPYFHKVCIMKAAGICSTDILVFRAKEDCWKGFVQWQLFTEKFVEYANARSTGTRMPRASWKDMVEYPIVKPSSEVSARFSAYIERFNTKAMLNVAFGANLAKLRDTLLPKLILGELDVS